MSTSSTIPKNPQLEPLELNSTTGEAFLRVDGFDDITITAQRWEDKEACVPYLNDPRVADFMSGPPLPYLQERAEKWMNHIIPPQKAILSQLEEARDQETLLTVGGCPVNAIRKVNEDGSDVFIGAIDISRHVGLGELVPADGWRVHRRIRAVKEENEKEGNKGEDKWVEDRVNKREDRDK
ncbi:hypothetical protein NMY22_g19166 [Coprinellus aureogranulatus]|nr:hypothetical protein NMY22_g19166 [Coprinellus aureogranulatus]